MTSSAAPRRTAQDGASVAGAGTAFGISIDGAHQRTVKPFLRKTFAASFFALSNS